MKRKAGRAVPCAPPDWKRRAPLPGGAPWIPRAALAALAAGLVAVGCKSVLVSTYISPRVTGRVLAADTEKPLAKVKVRRVSATGNPRYDEPAKGAQALDSLNNTWTDQEGAFKLDAEKDLTLLRRQVWYSVTVCFQRKGYSTLYTNFNLKEATNAPDGTPVVAAGNVLLQPIAK